MYYLSRKCYECNKFRKCIIRPGSVMNVISVENVLFVQEVFECNKCRKCFICPGSVMNVISVENVLFVQEVL